MILGRRDWQVAEPVVSEYGGGAVGVGTGWRAADGAEDAHRVRQRAPGTVLHWIYLEG